MKLIIEPSADDVAEFAALYVIRKIRESTRQQFTLGLPTGSTPLGMYRKLIEYHRKGIVSFKNVVTFNMDEYVGLPQEHPESYHSFMFNNFFKHIDIEPQNVHILDGNTSDHEQECERFEQLIVEHGGIDLFIGGVGPDGHLAFNEPGSSLTSRTRIKTLNDDTIMANARFFDNDVSLVPTQALTVGIDTIMKAREVMILATGAHKALAVHHAIEGSVSHMFPVSIVQMHQCAMFIVDESATLELKVKTVNYFKALMKHHQKLVQFIQ